MRGKTFVQRREVKLPIDLSIWKIYQTDAAGKLKHVRLSKNIPWKEETMLRKCIYLKNDGKNIR